MNCSYSMIVKLKFAGCLNLEASYKYIVSEIVEGTNLKFFLNCAPCLYDENRDEK